MNSTIAYDSYTPIDIGWPSLLPPIVAMGLALATKEVVSSLFIGVVAAAIIYSIAVGRGMNPNLQKANFIDVIFTVMGIKIGENVHICLFILFIGGLIHLVSVSGGARAYGIWAKKAIKGRRATKFSTMFLGMMMFLDDYFNTITTGTVMRTVGEVNHVSKPKLAYIVHTMSTNMCIMIPLTSWAAAIVSQIKSGGIDNPFVVFLESIPYNIYSISCFIFIIVSNFFDFDFGKMKFFEDNAKIGIAAPGADKDIAEIEQLKQSDKGKVMDLLLPIIVLILFALFFMFYLGGMFEGQGKSVTDVLRDTSAPKALLYACFLALLTTLLMYVPRKILSFMDWMEDLKEGMKTMVPTLIILTLAWCISGTSGDLLQTGQYVGYLVRTSPIPPQMIPAVVFVVGMALSFAMGTAWGTFGILIPIAVSICSGENRVYLVPSIASCLCGSVFGNNTSPISDTTILVSSAIQCPFLVHVSTQLPYAALSAIVSFVGFLVAGFSGSNLPLTLCVSLGLEILLLGAIYVMQKRSEVPDRVVQIELPEIKKGNENEGKKAISNNDAVDDVLMKGDLSVTVVDDSPSLDIISSSM